MTNVIVTRSFGLDYIYFDIIFLIIWVYFLAKKRYWIPIAWGSLGWAVYIFTDYFLWYIVTQTRQYVGPLNPIIFFMWFCFSPGFVQFSYVVLMFEKRNRNDLIFFTLVYYLGWIIVSVGSQLLPIDDTVIRVSRDMNIDNQRFNMIIMVFVNIIIAIFLYVKKKLRLEDVAYLFLVGTLVEFALELTLAVSGIRQEQGTWNLGLMILNSLIEFNLGIVLMYLLWATIKIKKFQKFYPQLSYKDFNYIKTHFDIVAFVCNSKGMKQNVMKDYSRLYAFEDFLSDINYYCEKYSNKALEDDKLRELNQYWK
ncbi:MAG: hypothetical protein ACFFD7_10930 [Candidatus Thorarchaeota archaeon]